MSVNFIDIDGNDDSHKEFEQIMKFIKYGHVNVAVIRKGSKNQK